ncbi:MAG TPA: His/Gly/Thr/Pro-type tRNA ligase C-terminal domain-containing protein, partial [Acidimicrobiales bacterium]|nr:His/Gly/Thr/Pro-type tRNA ligase C-terminal domain-containing protein [Acidimicrobiales bacterium]
LGGPPTPGIGFGIGIERLLLACDAEGAFAVGPPTLDAFVVDVVGGRRARDLVDRLRSAGLRAERAYDDRSMKAQLKLADRSGARMALIVGPDELAAGTVSVRPLRAEAGQWPVPEGDVVAAVREAAGGS